MGIHVPKKELALDIPHKFLPFLQPAPYKAAYGGRGSAKSHTVAGLLVMMGTQQKHKILCCREFQASIADSSKSLIEYKIKQYGLEKFYKITDSDIVGINGTQFIFKGLRLNVGALNSLFGVTICWIDEAQNISTPSLTGLLPTIREKGSELWATWNPGKPDDPIDLMFRTGDPPPGAIIIECNYYDNPWFHETSLVPLMEWDKKRDPAKYRHVWLGKYKARDDAQVFTNWRIGTIDVPEKIRAFYGIDWGYSVDPTVLVRCYIFEQKTLYVSDEAYAHKVEIDNLPLLFDRMEGSRYGALTADNARPELISYLKREGYRITPSVKGRNSVIEGIEFIRNHNVVIHPSCKNTIDEFTNMSWAENKNEKITMDLAKGPDHCVDAIRYAIEAARRDTMKISVRQIN